MSPEEITELIRQTLILGLELALPFLAISLIIGFLISLFQAVTSIQEMTLTFVPKIIAMGIALALLFPWMMKMMAKFTNHLLVTQFEKIVHSLDYVL